MADFRGYSSVFSRRLRELRDWADMSQAEVADALGVTKSSVSLYERGVNLPDADVVAGLARLYNVSADYLLGLSDTPRRMSESSVETMAKQLLGTIKEIYAQIQPIVED